MTSNNGEKPPHIAAAANEGVPSSASTEQQEARPDDERAPKDDTGCECKPKVVMLPELLRAARHGDLQRLCALLGGLDDDESPAPPLPTTSQDDDAVVLEVYRSSPLLPPSTTAGEGEETFSLLEGTTFQGDSLLHVVATSGDDDDFLKIARLIYGKAKHLLEATNNNGDTPLHCAARAGSVKMVMHLLKLAVGDGAGDQREEVIMAVRKLLRKQNHQHETVLHEAVRLGNKDLIDKLMSEDPELARHPSNCATSPLYLAVILLEDLHVAMQLHDYDKMLSYSGPDGQNVLHAAVLRSKEATRMLLDWNKDLTGKGDSYGRTPLHFAVSIEPPTKIPYYYKILVSILRYIDIYTLCLDRFLYPRKTRGDSLTLTGMLMDADESSAYQTDDKGSFPIHVAAAEGSLGTINILLNKSPNCATLLNAHGRTFLHVAVENGRHAIIMFVRRRRRLAAKIMNMQDNDGNTALHLAIQGGDLHAVLCLLMNPVIEVDSLNKEGLTPLDISTRLIPEGLLHGSHQRIWIDESLDLANANHANPSLDHRQEKCICRTVREERDSGSKRGEKDDHEQEDSKTITESTQVLAVCSTLIATVAFAAAFTLPGGYRSADDHTNGGTPTFVGSYSFGAFVLAITFAFIYSLLATFSLVYSGMTKVDYNIRLEHLNSANSLVWLSIRCLLVSFALGLYVVLAPVAHRTALLICLMCSAGLLHGHMSARTQIRMAVFLQGRIGFKVWWILGREILGNILRPFWPFLIIFGWPAYLKWRHQQ
uniref:PGG domain-containing protein n=1 Tax=Oryza punctata TaxID=4537 RepID=A0A0E0M024_ORYPU